jgi:hypothetical protein
LAAQGNPFPLSSKLLPLIVLVILPPIFIALPDIADYYGIDIPNDQIFWPFLLVVIFSVYILYHARLSPEKYFKNKGFEKTVYEFGFLQKILYGEIALFALCLAVLVIIPLVIPSMPVTAHNYFESRGFIEDDIFFSSIFSVAGTIAKIASLISRKEFRFYFARGCFMILSQEEEGHENVRYFIMGLNSYNKFLLQNMKVHIGDMKQIYSKFFCASVHEKREIIDSIAKAFEKGKSEPIKPLLQFVGDKKADEFLTREHFKAKTEHIVGILAPIIGVLLTMMEFWSRISTQFIPPPHP